jgi:hypothetical protein
MSTDTIARSVFDVPHHSIVEAVRYDTPQSHASSIKDVSVGAESDEDRSVMSVSPGKGLNLVLSSQLPASPREVALLRETPLVELKLEDLRLTLAGDGEGGTYFVRPNAPSVSPDDSDVIAVFKPAAEEIGCVANPRGNDDHCRVEGFLPGSGAIREVAAYQLDFNHEVHVPETVLCSAPGKGLGSLQKFVVDLKQSWNMTPTTRSRISLASLQKLALFDIRVMNTDRHGGNILIHPESGELFGIDHSYILPPRFVDPEWDWLTWPEALRPILPEVRAFYQSLDDAEDARQLEKLGLDEDALQLFEASSVALRMILEITGSNLTLFTLAQFFRRPTIATPSTFEEILAESRASLEQGGQIRFPMLREELRRQITQQYI